MPRPTRLGAPLGICDAILDYARATNIRVISIDFDGPPRGIHLIILRRWMRVEEVRAGQTVGEMTPEYLDRVYDEVVEKIKPKPIRWWQVAAIAALSPFLAISIACQIVGFLGRAAFKTVMK